MKIVVLLGLCLITTAQLFAQTEADMCVLITDPCCDASWSTWDYSVPAGRQITGTYVHYEGSDLNEVTVECWQMVNGLPSIRRWSVTDRCGCGTVSTTTGHPIGQNTDLRFTVKCMGCNSENCAIGSTAVYLYTSINAATCPTQCPKD
ncbi:MAG: hypothetical protein IPG71_03785 [bacterium]|nr:hypothetical protein [bacterium]